MTTEDDFQKALDARPDDHVTRLVFADWLEERDDPRAEGYRALGLLRKYPCYGGSAEVDFIWYANGAVVEHANIGKLWVDALWEMSGDSPAEVYWPVKPLSRREADDAAAIAFSKLSPERRAELLSRPVGGRP